MSLSTLRSRRTSRARLGRTQRCGDVRVARVGDHALSPGHRVRRCRAAPAQRSPCWPPQRVGPRAGPSGPASQSGGGSHRPARDLCDSLTRSHVPSHETLRPARPPARPPARTHQRRNAGGLVAVLEPGHGVPSGPLVPHLRRARAHSAFATARVHPRAPCNKRRPRHSRRRARPRRSRRSRGPRGRGSAARERGS
jgi:hypothetical protein